MIKNRPIITSILFLSLIILGVLIWRASLLFDNLSNLLPEAETNSEIALDTDTSSTQETFNSDTNVSDTDDSNSGHYETIGETVTRLKRDVVITGTVIGTAGKESAMFQIENMPDRSFDINTQLMDGFIITEITQTQITLKNQTGDEFFSLPVQSDISEESMQDEPINSELLPAAEPVPADTVNDAYPPDSAADEVGSSDSSQGDLRQRETNAATFHVSPEYGDNVSGQMGSAYVDGYPPESRPQEFKPIEQDVSQSGQMEPTLVDYGHPPESRSDEGRAAESADSGLAPSDNLNSDSQSSGQ